MRPQRSGPTLDFDPEMSPKLEPAPRTGTQPSLAITITLKLALTCVTSASAPAYFSQSPMTSSTVYAFGPASVTVFPTDPSFLRTGMRLSGAANAVLVSLATETSSTSA